MKKSPDPAPIDYLDPRLPAGLRRVPIPVVDATPEALLPYGRLVADPKDGRIEIVRWPAQGSGPVDADTGDQGGPTGRMLLWHANYHPDGGQLFFPLDRRSF